MKYKNIYTCLLAAAAFVLGSCNEVWEEEQYQQYVSFKAPSYSSSVTTVRVKYKEDGVRYRLPLLVSGTLNNEHDLDVHVGVDNDTLPLFNLNHFGDDRQDLWFRQLNTSRFFFNPVTRIPAGENSALIDILLDFNGLDFSEKWVLPLIVEDDPSYGYQSHPRLDYNNALLYFLPFNDFSGKFGASTLNVKVKGTNASRLPLNERYAYVVGENSVFFYAGAIDENRADRKLFKIKATFIEDETFVPKSGAELKKRGTVKLEAMNDIVGLDFAAVGTPTYEVKDRMDSETPTTMIRTLTVKGLNYSFNDPKRVQGEIISYDVDGSMTLERRINTTIPDEEFAIDWSVW